MNAYIKTRTALFIRMKESGYNNGLLKSEYPNYIEITNDTKSMFKDLLKK